MSHTSENMNSAGAEEEHQRESTQERPADTVARVFDEIKSIEEQAEPKPDARVAEMALRLGVDEAQLESVEQVVRFAERSRALTEKFHGIKDKFQENIRRTLLPVATALAMNSAPALAQEANTERPTTNGPETVLATKSESRELKKEDVFDVSSPLNITGEKMKALKREMLPEELALMKDFHRKAWQQEYEWAVVSGQDKHGKFTTKLDKLGYFGGSASVEIRKDIVSNASLMHTHPLDSYLMSGITSKGVRSGQEQPPLMPPSAGDIESCMQDSNIDSVGRVVDLRGVWEYRCDASHPAVEKRQTAEPERDKALKMLGLQFGIDGDDSARIDGVMIGPEKLPRLTDLIVQLDKKYPGIAKSGLEVLSRFSDQETEYVKNRLLYEQGVFEVARSSRDTSDEDVSLKIRNLIQNAERNGVYMSYTPFKELPKDKERQKE